LAVLPDSGRAVLIENERKVLRKDLPEKKKFAGKSRIVSLGHQPPPSLVFRASSQPISKDRWKKRP